MKKAFIKVLSVMLVVVMSLTAAPLSGFIGLELPEWLDFSIESSAAASGTCGDSLTWNFDESTGTLTISGTGDMEDYYVEIESNLDNRPWKSYADNVKKIVIENGVTSIGEDAFFWCNSLESITIPDSVTTIGDNAFSSCTSLTNITIPDNVTTIGDYAFAWCNSLESITILDSVTSIGENAFYCTAYYYDTNNWEEDVLYLGNYLIDAENRNVEYKIKEGTLVIADRAFYNSSGLISITIPNSVKVIGSEAFYFCKTLTSMTIGNGVRVIGNGAFYYCTSLRDVTIPDSVTSIGDNAFHYCISLTSINVDSNNQYYSNDEYGVLFNKDKTTLVRFPIDNTKTNYIIPESVTTIDNHAFEFCASLTSVTILDGVTTICDGAFSDCTNLTSITIPDSVIAIGEQAFYRCTSIENAIIGNNVINSNNTTIGRLAFSACASLKSVTIGNNITIISDMAFSTCRNLTSITIPDSVTTIGDGVFSDCTSLTSINVDSNNQYYSNDEYGVLFNKDKTALVQYPIGNISTTYPIPDSVTTIGNGAFSSCTSFTNITIPDGVTTIGDDAFSSCTSLKNITIPDSVITIGSGAFRDCTSLESVEIPNNVTMIGKETFWYCTSLEKVTIGNSVTTIGQDAFYNCTSLTSLTIPDGVTTISYSSFGRCISLTNVIIPNSLKVIGNEAFVVCISLTDVYYKGTEEEWNKISIRAYNETLINANIHFNYCEHKFVGEWEVVLEPTYEAEGKQVKKCTACGEIVEEEIIPMLVKTTVTDEDTGILLEYPSESYGGEVDIVVEESFEGNAFDVIDTTLVASQKFIYDITMTVDGETTQPNGKVTIKIPLPDGYDPNRSFIYYVNTETGQAEKMDAIYEDGYLVFETDHFSYYAVVEEYNYTFSIQTPSMTTIRHKDGIKLHANIEGNAPEGSYIKWTASNGKFKTTEINDGNSLQIISDSNGKTTFTATLYSADGEALAEDEIEMTSKAGFFDKIISFFRSLFGATRIYDK